MGFLPAGPSFPGLQVGAGAAMPSPSKICLLHPCSRQTLPGDRRVCQGWQSRTLLPLGDRPRAWPPEMLIAVLELTGAGVMLDWKKSGEEKVWG